MNISIWILIVYIILFPLFQIRRPDTLATCSIIANIFTLIGTITIFVHIFSTKRFTHAKHWQSENKVYWTKLPLTIGITFYAYQLVAPLVSTYDIFIKFLCLHLVCLYFSFTKRLFESYLLTYVCRFKRQIRKINEKQTCHT